MNVLFVAAVSRCIPSLRLVLMNTLVNVLYVAVVTFSPCPVLLYAMMLFPAMFEETRI